MWRRIFLKQYSGLSLADFQPAVGYLDPCLLVILTPKSVYDAVFMYRFTKDLISITMWPG